jgi:hypothetical protein
MQYLAAAFLGIYLAFAAQFLVASGGLADNLWFQAGAHWVVLGLAPTAVTVLYFVSQRYRDGAISIRDRFRLSLIFSIFVYFAACVFLDKPSMLLITAAYLASIGWLYTNYTNTINQRKAHTMNILLQMRNSAEFQKHRQRLAARIVPIEEADLAGLNAEKKNPDSYKNGNLPLLDSVVYIGNYYEFVSVGVESGDLDEAMIFLTLRAIFVTFYNYAEPYILYAQKSNPRLYINLSNLVKKYRDS